MIIRNDDINPNSNPEHILEMYKDIMLMYPDAEIWSCISLLGKSSVNGSVYPELPLRNHDMKYFYKVNCFFSRIPSGLHKIVSHGLLHLDHSKLSKDAQEMSILTSCELLDTKIFVSPFSAFNETTKQICKNNDIHMSVPSDGWKSLESEPFNPKHELWFFHSWRFTPKTFREIIRKNI